MSAIKSARAFIFSFTCRSIKIKISQKSKTFDVIEIRVKMWKTRTLALLMSIIARLAAKKCNTRYFEITCKGELKVLQQATLPVATTNRLFITASKKT